MTLFIFILNSNCSGNPLMDLITYTQQLDDGLLFVELGDDRSSRSNILLFVV